MSRLTYLASNPKRSLGTLGVLLGAAGLTVGSGAFFSDTSASNGNSVAAGTLDVLVKGSGNPAIDANTCLTPGAAGCSDTSISTLAAGEDATFRVTNLVPTNDGHVITRRFAVENKGSVPARLRLTGSVSNLSTGGQALADAVRVSVARVGGGTVAENTTIAGVSGAIADRDGAGTRVAVPAGATYQYELTLRLPETNQPQNGLQGQSFDAKLTIDAQSVNGAAS